MTATQDTPTLTNPNADSASSSTIETLPAGGFDPHHFDWAEAWHPVHYVEDLDKSRPTRFTLLEQDLVIWWDPQDEAWRVFRDQCPHRLAPLSEGRVNEAGHLECPYHGWAFSGDGRCHVIPQAPPESTATDSPRACAQSLPTAVRQGLLFVYPGSAENAPQVSVPIIEPMESDSDGWVLLSTFRDLPYDALTLLENVLDSSHIPYTHHKSVGNRSNAGPMVDLDILESSKQGFHGTWPEGPRRGKLGQQYTTFVAPNLMWHDVTSQQFGRTLTVVYATPIRKGECRLFARFPFKFNSKLPGLFIKLTPRWYTHIGNNGVLEDDQIFLHLQERALAARNGEESYAQTCYLPTAGDRFVLEFRRWIDTYSADPFPGESLPPAWSQSELLDRYRSHTRHCGSCRPALQRIQKIQRGALVVGAIALALFPLLVALGAPLLIAGITCSVIPILSGALWLWLHRLEKQFYQGRAVPPRNLPERSAPQKST